MANDDRTYVIEPGATDPDLIRSLTPLGEDTGVPRRRVSSGRRRRQIDGILGRQLDPHPRPVLRLVGTYVLGPLAPFTSSRARRSRAWCAATVAGLILVIAAAWIWWREPAIIGRGDRAILIQIVALSVAALAWSAIWSAGLILAARRCGEGPLARRNGRRPFTAGLVGLLAPGLGLLLAGHPWRAAVAGVLVWLGIVAAAMLTRAGGWWTEHTASATVLFTDLQIETLFLGLVGLVTLGLLVWLASALESGRLANGPRVVRHVSAADRVPLALVMALVAFGIFFRPLDAARELDRFSEELAAAGLRLAPLIPSRTAVMLAPAEPTLELRLADRYDALGRRDQATAIRDDLSQRWQQIQPIEEAPPPDLVGPPYDPTPR